jgi:hypothetical protein
MKMPCVIDFVHVADCSHLFVSQCAASSVLFRRHVRLNVLMAAFVLCSQDDS